jgi:hypothetical protein
MDARLDGSAAEQLADGLAADGGGATGAAIPEGSPEERRTRVFTALASLLQPAGVERVLGQGYARRAAYGMDSGALKESDSIRLGTSTATVPTDLGLGLRERLRCPDTQHKMAT